MFAAKVKETGKAATVGEDKAHDAESHGEALRNLKVTPHVATSDAEPG